ncbi:MAG: adenylyl-sulfate kinase [Acidobacteria bacterium]|nr:MAG: adenylyl-sulfate kinase [Acidobacteriota bacterium]
MTGANRDSRHVLAETDAGKGSGWVFWITGLAGAGKTTIARNFFSILVKHDPRSVVLDGEELRRVVMPEAGYSISERFECARRYGLLCKLLSERGLNVVIATISMFEECREWNRKNLSHYFEVYIRAPMEVLVARDQRGLYSGRSGASANMVVGKDLPCEYPSSPDMTIDNDGTRTPQESAETLWQEVSTRIRQTRGGL